MVDNVTLPAAGSVVASDDIGGVQHQRVKLSVGADGSAVDLSPAAPMPIGDSALAVARGLVTDHAGLNKFGRARDVDSGVATDIWDRANATDGQTIWTPPTTARIHDIRSASANDAAAGTGARTIRVWGLTSWSTAEVSEDITMNGNSNVPTVNSYVIIHRMSVLTTGTGGTNAGDIQATAQTDSTITAQILAGQGQTQMAIYGIPSTQNLYVTRYYASAIKAASSLSVEVNVMFNPEPDVELAHFLVKHTVGTVTDGSNYLSNMFCPYVKLSGPGILKIQGNSSSNNTDVSGGFDGILVTE